MARLYGNENVALRLVEHLRSLGHDVLTSYEAGNANRRIGDDQVLADALADERIVLTNNRKDFRRLHVAGALHCGIVEYTFDEDLAALGGRIDQAVTDGPAVGRFYASVTRGGHSFR